MTTRIEEIEAELRNFAAETQQANRALYERLPSIDALANEYNNLVSEAGITERQKINIGKFGNVITAFGEIVQNVEEVCKRLTGQRLL